MEPIGNSVMIDIHTRILLKIPFKWLLCLARGKCRNIFPIHINIQSYSNHNYSQAPESTIYNHSTTRTFVNIFHSNSRIFFYPHEIYSRTITTNRFVCSMNIFVVVAWVWILKCNFSDWIFIAASNTYVSIQKCVSYGPTWTSTTTIYY